MLQTGRGFCCRCRSLPKQNTPTVCRTDTAWQPTSFPDTRSGAVRLPRQEEPCRPARYSQHKDIVVLQHDVESFFGGITPSAGKVHGTSSVVQPVPLHPGVDAQCSIIWNRQKKFFRGWFRISNSPPHSRPDNEAAYKTPPFRTERKGGVSVGKTVVDYFQGYTRSEQTLPGSLSPDKWGIFLEKPLCYLPFAIELVMLGTHFVIGRTIQFQPVYACLNLLLQRGRQLRVGKDMPAYEFQIKPTILDFKRIENIREVPFAAVYCGTGQTVIAPFVRKIRAQRLGEKMLYVSSPCCSFKENGKIGTNSVIVMIQFI